MSRHSFIFYFIEILNVNWKRSWIWSSNSCSWYILHFTRITVVYLHVLSVIYKINRKWCWEMQAHVKSILWMHLPVPIIELFYYLYEYFLCSLLPYLLYITFMEKLTLEACLHRKKMWWWKMFASYFGSEIPNL